MAAAYTVIAGMFLIMVGTIGRSVWLVRKGRCHEGGEWALMSILPLLPQGAMVAFAKDFGETMHVLVSWFLTIEFALAIVWILYAIYRGVREAWSERRRK